MKRLNYAIILAGGIGSRSGLAQPKQFLKIKDKSIIEYSIECFENHQNIDKIVIVCNKDYIEHFQNLVDKNNYTKILSIVGGGMTRQQSSFNGVSAILKENVNVLIHDAVRPFITQKIITDCLEELKYFNAVTVAIKAIEAMIEVNEDKTIKFIPKQKNIMNTQSPNCFYLPLIKEVQLKAIAQNDLDNNDNETALVMKYSNEVIKIVDGDEMNKKVTTPLDVLLVDKLLELNQLTDKIE